MNRFTHGRPVPAARLVLSLLALLVLAGCATERITPTQAAPHALGLTPTPHAPSVRVSSDRERVLAREAGITEEGLRSFLEADARHRDRVAAIAPRGVDLHARVFGRRAPPTRRDDIDPLAESMGRLPEGYEWSPDLFVPSGGGVDLGGTRPGTWSGRAWTRDDDLRGVGLGYRAAMGDGWHGAAEVGVDPFGDLADGGLTLLVGVGRRL